MSEPLPITDEPASGEHGPPQPDAPPPPEGLSQLAVVMQPLTVPMSDPLPITDEPASGEHGPLQPDAPPSPEGLSQLSVVMHPLTIPMSDPLPITMQPVPSGYGPPQPGVCPPPEGLTQTVVVMQPLGVGQNWMIVPRGIPNCTPGLEYLAVLDRLMVNQKLELLEAVTGLEGENKYVVKNSMGQKIYLVTEDTDCLTRECCGTIRPFDMKILDNVGNEIIHLYRPLAGRTCLCPCCLQSLDVFAPPGNFIGRIEQTWSILAPHFNVQNAAGDTVLTIKGPVMKSSMCGTAVEFKVLSLDGMTQVGKISKEWTGLAQEYFTDIDNFGISFPMDLDVNVKAVMLGAVFLIDFMFYERSGKRKGQKRRQRRRRR